jgi:hypothetical protein
MAMLAAAGCGRARERRGPSQALWSIRVHSQKVTKRSGGHDYEVTEEAIWWEDSGRVHFGECMDGLSAEKAWIVQEVLAWLEQVGPPKVPPLPDSCCWPGLAGAALLFAPACGK